MQNINVNIVPDNFPQTIRYSQGDIGRQFKINVTDFEIPNGATVKIQATKPSGFGFSVAGVVAGSSVTFTTTAEMTDEAGRFQAELQITAGDDVIGTANFLMIGERNPHPEGTTDGSQGTIIPELTLLVERVEKAASDVLDMEVVATTLPAGSQATYSYDEDLNKATFGIPEGQAGAGAAGVVASAYSAAKTYKVGDYVLYNSNLYRCTTAISTAEAWTAAHWTQVVLADDVTDLKSNFADFEGGNIHIPSAKFSNGALQNDGTINTQNYFASNNVDLLFDYPIKISVKDGYKYAVALKPTETTYIVGSFITYDFFIPSNTPFRLKIGRVTETWGTANLEEFSRQINIIAKDRAELLFNSAQIAQLKNGDELLDAVFERGSISNGDYVGYVNYRIATPNVVRFNKPITITSDNGFKFGVHTFDSEDTYITDLGWKTNYTIEANQGFKLIVARSTEDTSEVADVFEFYTKIHTESPFKDYVNELVADSALLSAPILQNGKPKLVAHMGYRANAPENTVLSFINAGKAGYWGIESDVQQTSDGYYVMMHDTTVDRTTNGTGNINEMTLAQIRALQIKDYPDLKVPTFEEYLAICKWYGCVPTIEIKSTVTNSKASFEKLIGIVKSFGFDDKGVIFCGSKWAFDNFRKATQTIPYMAIYQYGLSYVWATEFAFCSQYKNAGMSWDILNGLTFENCEDAHEKDMLICAFITDSTTDVMTSFSVGADFCTTNVVLPTD